MKRGSASDTAESARTTGMGPQAAELAGVAELVGSFQAGPRGGAPTAEPPRTFGPQNQDAMSGETLHRTVTITNPQGFHLRPAAAFARLAGGYQSRVVLVKDEQRFNGKSPLELMMMVALPNTRITLEVSGPDAGAALEALASLLAAPSTHEEPDDDESAVPTLPRKG